MKEHVLVNVDGRPLKLSNLDKVLFNRSGFTKRDVIDYYDQISQAMLPHLAGRPLTLKRYPDGVAEDFFFEKQCPSHRPDWMATACVAQEHSSRGRAKIDFCLADTRAALLWVANLASIEMHVLLSTADDLKRPTAVVFDLDPGLPAGLAQCAQVAMDLRDMLSSIGLASMVKSSGSKGLHLYVPLNSPAGFSQTKDFAHAVAGLMEQRNPMVVTNMRRNLRAGRVFVDWSQNERFKTTVCVYSMRAVDPPRVSMPLSWKEVQRVAGGAVDLAAFAPKEAIARVKKLGDLFAPVLSMRQSLPSVALANEGHR